MTVYFHTEKIQAPKEVPKDQVQRDPLGPGRLFSGRRKWERLFRFPALNRL